jgi:hypothetical protein
MLATVPGNHVASPLAADRLQMGFVVVTTRIFLATACFTTLHTDGPELAWTIHALNP